MSEFNEPPKSDWATFHRGCGWFLFVLGGIGFVMFLNASERSDKGAPMQLLILGIAGGITSFFAAFLIDVFTDMRHYLQSGNSTLAEMNAKLTGLATGQLKIEAEAEAADRVASVAEAKAFAEKQAAEAKAAAEKQAAEAKEAQAFAEKQAAEAMAAAKPATEKRLEWTGKAMQRAGFKEETLKRALTQGGTLVAWGSDSFGITKVPAGLSGVVAIAGGWLHTVALKLPE